MLRDALVICWGLATKKFDEADSQVGTTAGGWSVSCLYLGHDSQLSATCFVLHCDVVRMVKES